jgi:hypothetical protein
MLPVYRTGCLRFERQYPRPSFSVDPSRRAEATGLDMERLLSGLDKMPAYHGRAYRHDVARLCTCQHWMDCWLRSRFRGRPTAAGEVPVLQSIQRCVGHDAFRSYPLAPRRSMLWPEQSQALSSEEHCVTLTGSAYLSSNSIDRMSGATCTRASFPYPI